MLFDRNSRIGVSICWGLLLSPGALTFTNDLAAENLPAKVEEFAPGDVLRVFAFGRDDLTGKFTVQSGRIISLPLLGPVSLSGKTTRDLEGYLSSAWEERLGAPQSITVEFLERAPFYILGAVNTPGAYPYRPGLTAMQAIALGGGVQRALSSDPRLRLDILRERERRERAVEAMADALAERARLEAERDKASAVRASQALRDIANPLKVDALIAEQTRLFRARIEHLNTKLAHLDEQVRLSGEEVATYQRQHEALRTQEELINKELARVQSLRDTGYGLQSRVFEMQQRLSALSADMIGVLGGVARARTSLAAAKTNIGQLREEREKEIAEALILNERKFREATVVEQATRQLLRSVGGAAAPSPELRLVRAGAADAVLVGPTTEVRPGDVLELWLPPDEFGASSSRRAEAN